MKSYIKTIAVMAAILLVSSCGQKKAKYVFLFIGDGMGFNHVAMTELYKAQSQGHQGMDALRFSSFPVLGQATNFSANKQITCSSAAGTAISTGHKTNNYMLGVTPDSTKLTSITYNIHNAGYSIGIMSNVQVNHATPASFFGSAAYRGDYYDLGCQMVQSGFEFFAGGGIIDSKGKDSLQTDVYDLASEAGYTLAYGRRDFESKRESGGKFLMVQKEGSQDIGKYALGRDEDSFSLKDAVASAVEVLERNRKGFFLMAEGGLLDWVAHSHDLAGTVAEVLDLDEAVEVAYQFYLKHPGQTLIIVTADHETGGCSLGSKRSNGYVIDMTVIDSVKTVATTTDVQQYLSDETVLENITDAAHIGWATTSHTAALVPIWAIGAGSEKFAGRMDNTDIASRICEAMGVEFNKQ